MIYSVVKCRSLCCSQVKKHKETAQFRCGGCSQVFAMRTAMKRHHCIAGRPTEVEAAMTPEAAVLLKKDAPAVRHVIMTNMGPAEISEADLGAMEEPTFVIKQEHSAEEPANQQVTDCYLWAFVELFQEKLWFIHL